MKKALACIAAAVVVLVSASTAYSQEPPQREGSRVRFLQIGGKDAFLTRSVTRTYARRPFDQQNFLAFTNLANSFLTNSLPLILGLPNLNVSNGNGNNDSVTPESGIDLEQVEGVLGEIDERQTARAERIDNMCKCRDTFMDRLGLKSTDRPDFASTDDNPVVDDSGGDDNSSVSPGNPG